MAISRSKQLLRKSVSAMIAAIEIYNKPDFQYREETFSILALNSWELLLKSIILKYNFNNLRSIYAYKKGVKKDGSKSSKQIISRNRAGNPYTIGIKDALNQLEAHQRFSLDKRIIANLNLLMEIRDNAIHFFNNHPNLAHRVFELGSATIMNFVCLVQKEFNFDLSSYNFFIMPLSFFRGPHRTSLIPLTQEERNFMSYMSDLEALNEIPGEYQIIMEVNISLKKTAPSLTSMMLSSSKDPNAIPYYFTDDQLKQTYPWTYNDLHNALKERYSDYKLNSKAHAIRKSLLTDQRYVFQRKLDPSKTNTSTQDFYSRNILNEYDKHYTRMN